MTRLSPSRSAYRSRPMYFLDSMSMWSLAPWSGPRLSTMVPRTTTDRNGFWASTTVTATLGSRSMLLALRCPSTVLMRTCVPSGSTSTHTGVAWGEPSGMMVDRIARCFSWSSFTPLGDNRSARGIFKLPFNGWPTTSAMSCPPMPRRACAAALPAIRAQLLQGVVGELRVDDLLGRQALVERAPLDELPLGVHDRFHVQPPVRMDRPPGHLVDRRQRDAGVRGQDRPDHITVLALHEVELVAHPADASHAPTQREVGSFIDP